MAFTIANQMGIGVGRIGEVDENGVMLWLVLFAAPLPADVWSVSADGRGCVQLEADLAAELATWHEDPDSSAPEEGIFGRVNPKDSQQLVLLFASKGACQRIVWAVGEEAKASRPTNPLDHEQLRAKVDALVAAKSDLKKLWTGLSAKQRKAIRAAAEDLFAGDVHRVRARKRIAILQKKKSETRSRDDRVRLALWLELYAAVFGEPFTSGD